MLVVTVVDEGGSPVAGAPVSASVRGRKSAVRRGTTDTAGRVEIGGLPAGRRVDVSARRDPYLAAATRTVKPAPDGKTEVRLVLSAGGAVTGSVYDETGARLAVPYRIDLRRVGGSASTPFPFPAGRSALRRSFPAGTGIFEIGGVPPGRYVAEATAEGCVPGRSEPFEVVKEATTRDVVIRLSRGSTISGLVVRSRSGEPVAGASVWVRPHDRFSFFLGMQGRPHPGAKAAKTDDQGRFTIRGVAPGEVEVIASAPDLAPGSSGKITVEKGRDVIDALVSLGEGGTIMGTVFGPGGRPMPGAEVLVSREMGNVRIYGDFGRRVKADESGVYRAEHLAPGKYRVRTPRGGGGVVMATSVTITGGSAGKPEEVPDDAEVVRVREGEVTRHDLYDTEKGALRGVVLSTSGKPLRKQVTLQREGVKGPLVTTGPGGRARIEIPRFAFSDAKGGFHFDNLDPGPWTVRCEGREKRVVIAAGATRKVTFRIPLSTVRGLVLDASGRPVPDANLSLRRVSLSGGGRMIFTGPGRLQTDDHGRFEITDVSPGEWEIRARKGDARGRSDRFTVIGGEDVTGIRIYLETTVEVRVEVTDKDGKPVAGAFVNLQGDFTGHGRTGEKGVAVLHVLPGDYRLFVFRPVTTGGVRVAGSLKEPRRVTVTRGATQTIPVRLD